METTLAVMERQQQFDFQKNGIEVMNFETLQRTYKENDIYNNPVQGIYHYQVIRRMMDICEKYNLDYEVEEIFAAQNRNKTQPGVSILRRWNRHMAKKPWKRTSCAVSSPPSGSRTGRRTN